MSTESNKSIEAHLAEIAAEAERIDPRTAKMVCLWVENHDHYGLGLDISPDEAQPVGRHPDLVDGRVTEYFLVDPEGDGPAVLVDAVRGLHPDIGDEEWGTLMSAAADRDDSPDPLYAHAYRRARPLKEPSKQELLDHYAEKPVTRLLQIDGFIDMVSDSFFEADSDGIALPPESPGS